MATDVSLAMICRDNEKTILAALQDAKRAGCTELVVVDTGSIDNTKEIAKQAGAEVYERQWIDDFAYSKNQAIELTSNDWVLILDSDDRFENPGELKAFFRDDLERVPASCSAVMFDILAGVGPQASNFVTTRLIRKSSGIRYKYPVHEILDCSGHDVYHFKEGYIRHEQPIHDSHASRNLRILEKARSFDNSWRKQQNHYKQHIRLNLGREYLGHGQFDKACKMFREYFKFSQTANERMGYWPNLYYGLALQDLQAKITQFKKTIRCNVWRAEAYVELGRIYTEQGRYPEAIETLTQAMNCPRPIEQMAYSPDYTWRAPLFLAVALEKSGNIPGAMQFAKLSQQRGAPQELLRNAFS